MVYSYRVGLQIKEELIDSSADTSLQDNAQGTNNENAMSADRLKISLILSKVSLTDTTDVNFIELGRVNNGIIEMEINRPIYSEIEQTFARRTFDTNGDFTVRPFTQTFREHLKTTHNRGFYLVHRVVKKINSFVQYHQVKHMLEVSKLIRSAQLTYQLQKQEQHKQSITLQHQLD